MDKKEIRDVFRKKRRELSQERKQEAAQALFAFLLPQLRVYRKILSFDSSRDEISLALLNETLFKENTLLLPKIEGKEMIPYQITNMKEELKLSVWGIREPLTSCLQIAPAQIPCILVPGIAFDSHNQRVGYGLGYYDRFLSTCPGIVSIGVGFKEQKVEGLIPVAEHDVPLTYLYLF